MRCNRNTTKKLVAAASFELQSLESRTMMTAVGLGVKFSGGLLTVTGTTGARPDHRQPRRRCPGRSPTADAWTVHQGTLKNVTKLSINGGNGNDTITLDSSVTCPATLAGGNGNDTIVGGSGASSIDGGAGADSLTAGPSNDTITGDAGSDTLLGGGGADKLIGGADNDSISGGSGNDTIQGGLGSDTLNGGTGINVLDYSDHTVKQPIVVDLSAGTETMTGEADTLTGTFQKFVGGAGNDLITGTDGDDIINGGAGNDTINGLGGNDQIWDGAGNDSVNGGDGNDSLYGGAGNDSLNGGDGDDQIIAIGGGTADQVTGGNGNDTFWIDNSVNESVTDADSTEIAEGAVHKVTTFKNDANKELTGGAIADPKVTSTTFKYHNFSNRPIFGADGPSINDIAQGQTGDCYFLATLASVAKLDPMKIQQSIVSLGDGTYAVQFFKGSTPTYVRVDADLATYSWSATAPAYANFGADGSIWAPLIEKAFAYFRKGVNTYASLNSGMMSEVYGDLGVSNVSSLAPTGIADAATYVQDIKNLLDAGDSVTAACYSTGGANMITSHAYTVDHVVDNGDGTFSVVVRNPWGVDGNTSTDGANDGYVTLTAAQAFVALGYVQAAMV